MPVSRSMSKIALPPWWAHPLLYGVGVVVLIFLDWFPFDPQSVVMWVFLGALLLGFFGANWWYLRPRRELAHALDAALTEEQSDEAGGGAPPPMFKGHDTLRAQWQKFRRHPSPTDETHPGPAGPSTVSASEFFTKESVLGKRHSKLPDALPGVFTAIGLLGTFVGIAIGLEGIDLDAPSDERLDAIGQLMDGMSTAFLTSIVGITQSVWWLIVFRCADRALESSLDGFLVRAEEAYPAEQPHDTLMRIAASGAALERMDESATAIRETTRGIKGEIQQLGQDLSGALERHLKTYVTDPLQELNTELGERQQEALQRMVESFQNTLVSSVGERLNEFGEALRSATDHQVRAAKELGRFFDRLDEVADTQTKLLRRTSEVAAVFDSGLARLVEAKEAIAEAGGLARETMEAASRLSLECQRQLEAQERASEAAARSWETQVAATEHLHRELRDLMTHLTAKVAEFRTLSAQKIGEVFHSFDAEMAKVTDHLSGTMDELREIARMLVGAVRPLPEAVDGLRDTTGELSRVSDAHGESLSAGIREFRKVHEELAAGMEHSLSEVRSAFGQLPALTEAMRSGHQVLTTASAEIGARLESLSTRTAASSERTLTEMAKVLDSVGGATGRIEDAVSTVVGALEALEARASAGSETMVRASEATHNLTRTVEQVREQVASLVDAGAARSDALQETVVKLLDATERTAKGLARVVDAVRRPQPSGIGDPVRRSVPEQPLTPEPSPAGGRAGPVVRRPLPPETPEPPTKPKRRGIRRFFRRR